DEAWYAAGEPPHFTQPEAGKDLARGAGNPQAVTHIGRAFVGRQRREVIAAGDALRELAQLGARKYFSHFRLADQNDLQQLLGFGFEIGHPALREVLARTELRQLAQRITGRYHLAPL